ncbi:unnamed protein product [Periconia digitata]|uniref:F-box domain-containing protein n=1 Tax=Periconia digitata TaxID=1303443 RepID=A0A9W4XEP9_9PLEO|nr:unnamed protein product [Periconia digitata]
METFQIQNLSVDLLYIIFSQLQDDKPSLHNLTLSCHLFRNIAQPFFVRNVTLSYKVNSFCTSLFLRTLEQRPDLAGHVHRLQLDLIRESSHIIEEVEEIQRMVARLTNLRVFRYSSIDYKIWHYELAFPLIPSPTNLFNSIHRVEWHHNMTFETLSQCMSLPHIETIYCRELFCDPSDPSDPIILDATKGSSSVTDLSIGSYVGLSIAVLQKILELPRALRKLKIDITSHLYIGVPPHKLATLLYSLQDVLEQLTVVVVKGARGPATELADLSGFSSLRSLTLPYGYIIAGQNREDNALEKYLPPFLEELTLSRAPVEALDGPLSNRNGDIHAGRLSRVRITLIP